MNLSGREIRSDKMGFCMTDYFNELTASTGRTLSGCQARFGCDRRESCERYRVFRQSPLVGFHAVQTCRTSDVPHFIERRD